MSRRNNVNEHPENIYAKNVRGEEVFIKNCTSGRKGYFCLGCGREMQAVRFKIDTYRSYSRHDYEYSSADKKCTYSSETYRHKLAKDELQLSRQIKVPQLLKYHPTDVNAIAFKLRDAELIRAHTVHNEMPFFENEYGEIAWGRDASFRDEHLLIQPDVAFFNEKNEPILLIEIVATHKISDEKKAKIRRLGINTVQITVPKDSPEAIAESLKSSQRVKWVYHNEEANTDYLQLSQSNSETVSYPDAEQRKLLGETLTCREAEIRSLIHSINLCLLSERYRDTRASLESEFAKVKKFTEQQETTLREFEESYRVGYSARFVKETARIDDALQSETAEIGRAEKKHRELEERYFRKKAEVEQQLKETGGRIQDIGRSSSTKESAIERETRSIVDAIDREELAIRDIESTASRFSVEIGNLEGTHEREKRSAFQDLERVIRKEEEYIGSIEARRRTLPDIYRGKEKEVEEQFCQQEDEAEARFRDDKKQLRAGIDERRIEIKSAIERGIVDEDTRLPEIIKRIISEFESLRTIAEKRALLERVKTAQRTIGDRTYKNILARYCG